VTARPSTWAAATVNRPARDPAPRDQLLEACRRAARHLYDEECLLHAARQSHVPEWINAAADKLHAAVEEHTRAAAALAWATRPKSPTCRSTASRATWRPRS
jgi:hypothetical protein